jgi:hypothetical protein
MDGHRGSGPDDTFDLDSAAVQIEAALNDHQSKARTGPLTDILPAVKGMKEPWPILFRNANPAIADHDHRITPVLFDRELDRHPGFRVLHRIGKEVGEHLAQKILVSEGLPKA